MYKAYRSKYTVGFQSFMFPDDFQKMDMPDLADIFEKANRSVSMSTLQSRDITSSGKPVRQCSSIMLGNFGIFEYQVNFKHIVFHPLIDSLAFATASTL